MLLPPETRLLKERNMTSALMQQSDLVDLTDCELKPLVHALDMYPGFWRPVVSSAPNPISRESGTTWLCVYWTGPTHRGFIPPVAVVRGSLCYYVVVLDPFVWCNSGSFEEMPCRTIIDTRVLFCNILDELWNVLFQVDQRWTEEEFCSRTESEPNGPERAMASRKSPSLPKRKITLFNRIRGALKSVRVAAAWRVIALSTGMSLVSIGAVSNAWGFNGEACGRYAPDYEDLRWCQVDLELGAIDEVATRTGILRQGSGQDWYLDHTNPQEETLWVDIGQLSDAERSRLADQCGQKLCMVRLTGSTRDHMINITSIGILRISQEH